MATPETPPRKPPRAVPIQEVRRAQGDVRVPVVRSKLASTRAFRRIRADRFFGTLGILFILVAALLVFKWEQTVPVTPAFSIGWDEATNPSPSKSETATETERTKIFEFAVQGQNITRVHLWAFWKDTVGDQPIEQDNLTIEVEGPGGNNTTVTLKRENLFATSFVTGRNETFNVPIQDVPEVRRVAASTQAQARALVEERVHPNTFGSGTWKVTVTLNDAVDDYKDETLRYLGNCPDQSPPTACIPDKDQQVTVGFEYGFFRANYTQP